MVSTPVCSKPASARATLIGVVFRFENSAAFLQVQRVGKCKLASTLRDHSDLVQRSGSKTADREERSRIGRLDAGMTARGAWLLVQGIAVGSGLIVRAVVYMGQATPARGWAILSFSCRAGFSSGF